MSYARVLLSLMSPGWTTYKAWRWLSYRELAEVLHPQVAHIRAIDVFAGDLVEHYVVLISRLTELLELLGTPAPDEPLLLSPTVAGYLERARISAGVQKARASYAARELCKAVTEKEWSDVHVEYGFTRGTSLLEGFCCQQVGATNSLGDALGWQIQGERFKLVVKTGVLQGSAHREEREAYVTKHYSDWFDFGPLQAVVGTRWKERSNEVRGGRWNFQGYDPDFVYHYRIVGGLTLSQVVELGLLYLDRARKVLNTNGRSATGLVYDKHNRVSEM